MAQVNTRTKLPGDEDSAPIQVLAPAEAVYISVGAVSARAALPSNTEIVMLACEMPCWVTFGGASVTSASVTTPGFLFPGGVMMLKVPALATHVAAVQNSEPTTLSISRMV